MRLEGARRRLTPYQAWGHLKAKSAAFKLWLASGALGVCRVTKNGFLDKMADLWSSHACAVLLLVSAILRIFVCAYHMGAHTVNATAAISGHQKNRPPRRVVGGFLGHH
jgi:hypothetical protein